MISLAGRDILHSWSKFVLTGIGLDLIGRLCEHLGWRLSLSSDGGKGTEAVLDLRVRSQGQPGAG